LIEGLRAQAIGVYMPRLQKQEELVPISDKLRHTDAVQALFIMLVAFLHTFQVRTVTWQQPFRPARREGSCACAWSHTAVLPGRVSATRGDVRTSGRHGAVCSVRHLPVQYVFRAAMRLLRGWAVDLPQRCAVRRPNPCHAAAEPQRQCCARAGVHRSEHAVRRSVARGRAVVSMHV